MDVNVIRSDRKTIAIQINQDFSVTVRAPRYASDREIRKILREKSDWIEKHLEQMKKQRARYEAQREDRMADQLTDTDIRALADKAMEYIPRRVRYFSEIAGVNYGRITIRNQKTRWGSCSTKGNLNFNCLLMLTPPEVIDYVVVHELCHRLEMNHSKAFWSQVERVLPDYKAARRWLKGNGAAIMSRMVGEV